MAAESVATIEPFGALAPGALDAMLIAATSNLPDNWLGLRLAMALRRLVTMRLSDDGALDVERWGLRLRLHPRHNGCEKGLLFTPQFYEALERAALATQIDKARIAGRPFVFVDIGANVGLFSFFVAARAGRDATILAIEPERENVRRLRFNIAANKDLPIRVLPHALGEAAGTLGLELDARDRGGTRTLFDGTRSGVTVESKSLTQVLGEQGVCSVDALKIDVEGAEDRILLPFFKSAQQDLWPRFILIEDARSAWQVDLFAEMKARGYKIASRTKQNAMMER